MMQDGIEGSLSQHDAENIAQHYGLSVDVAKSAIKRLGLSTTVFVLCQVADFDPTYKFFEKTFPRVEKRIPEIRAAVRHLTRYGLAVGESIDIALRHGNDIYKEGFSPLLALQELESSRAAQDLAESDERARQSSAEVDVEMSLQQLTDELSGDIPLCPHYIPSPGIHVRKGGVAVDPEREVYCAGECPMIERPMTCLGVSKPLANLLGTSDVREFETTANDPEAGYILTLLNRM